MPIYEYTYAEERACAVAINRQWRATMAFRPSKDKLTPTLPLPPMEQPRLSDKAASFGQQILDLEEGLARAQANAEDYTRALAIEQGDNERLRKALERAEHENKRLLKITSQLEGMFTAAAKIILEANSIIDRDVRAHPAPAYAPKPEALRNMARAVMPAASEEKAEPIPEYLRKQKETDDGKPPSDQQ